MKKDKMPLGQMALEDSDVGFIPNYSSPINYFAYSDIELINTIKKGISKKTMDRTMVMMSLSLEEMSGILHISERTLRRYDNQTFLNTEQSERIVELNRLYSVGIEVFGTLDIFKQWMDSPIRALANKKPKEFLDTSVGIKMLHSLLGRIEQGVYS
jgi:putative toxin-antitoxin system antitoxin component (TIGR02293 family)